MTEKRKLKRGEWIRLLTDEERHEISSLGGKTVSEDREHMAEIGKKGGNVISIDREYMRKLAMRSAEVRRKKAALKAA